jgi:hypothetical protein
MIISMKEGINFIVDSRGRKIGVLIDLARHGEIWKRCQKGIRVGPSVRVRGICAKVDEERIGSVVMGLRRLLGMDYRIIIDKNRICVEGDLKNHALRKKIDGILADEEFRSIKRGMNDIRAGRVMTEKEFLKKHPELK